MHGKDTGAVMIDTDRAQVLQDVLDALEGLHLDKDLTPFEMHYEDGISTAIEEVNEMRVKALGEND